MFSSSVLLWFEILLPLRLAIGDDETVVAQLFEGLEFTGAESGGSSARHAHTVEQRSNVVRRERQADVGQGVHQEHFISLRGTPSVT